MSQPPDPDAQENTPAPAPLMTSKHYFGVALVAGAFAFAGYLFAQNQNEPQVRPAPPAPEEADPVRQKLAWSAPRPRTPVRAAQDDEAVVAAERLGVSSERGCHRLLEVFGSDP